MQVSENKTYVIIIEFHYVISPVATFMITAKPKRA